MGRVELELPYGTGVGRVELAYDLETTGFSKQKDRIVQIAVCIVSMPGYTRQDCENPPPNMCWQSLVNPGARRMHPEAAKITRISDSSLSNAASFPVVWNRFLTWLSKVSSYRERALGLTLIGHNSDSFDNKFLCAEFERHAAVIGSDPFLCPCEGVLVGDTLATLKQHYKGQTPPMGKLKLGEVYRYWTGRELVGAHDALADCTAVAELMSWPAVASGMQFRPWRPYCTDAWEKCREGFQRDKGPSRLQKRRHTAHESMAPQAQSNAPTHGPPAPACDGGQGAPTPIIPEPYAPGTVRALCSICGVRYSPYFSHQCDALDDAGAGGRAAA